VAVQEIDFEAAVAAGRARQVEVPAAARALSSLHRIDYEDAFLAGTAGTPDLTPERWARAMLEDAPAKMRLALRWTWLVLGLRLGWGRSGQRVLGWRISRSSPDFVLLAAGSLLGMQAELLLERRDGTLLCATFLQQHNPLARAAWAPIQPGHRQAVPDLLDRAIRRARQVEPAG
jgi:hypothetical protein